MFTEQMLTPIPSWARKPLKWILLISGLALVIFIGWKVYS